MEYGEEQTYSSKNCARNLTLQDVTEWRRTAMERRERATLIQSQDLLSVAIKFLRSLLVKEEYFILEITLIF